jgi:acetylglutamate kinase
VRIVVKLAGALLEERRALDSIAAQIAQLASDGHELLVIHGGGRIFTSTLARMGITSRFVDGLRVTDAETRDAAIMVFAGLLNRRVTASISRTGIPAVGVCGADGSCFSARALDSHGGPHGLGFVGRLAAVNLDFLSSLWRTGVVPVSPCLAADHAGEIYNINADQMASAAAACIHAHKLVFLTDVPGVLDSGEVKQRLDGCEIEESIHAGFVSGGMILKLQSAVQALDGGVSSVRIVGGFIPGALLAATSGRGGPGTQIVRAQGASAAATGASATASRGCP